LTTPQLELAIVKHFRPRVNLIVPNIWWGMGLAHECDLLIMTPLGYCTEVELKISKSDLIADQSKRKWKRDTPGIIKALYFAIPEELLEFISEIPEHAGILVCGKYRRVKVIRKPKINPNHRALTIKEQAHLARLGMLRVWKLKTRLAE